MLATDIVVIGIGIVPNVELAAECGLDVSNGIAVDDHCRTTDPDIYAALTKTDTGIAAPASLSGIVGGAMQPADPPDTH